jgi:hypothetical protein
VNSVAPGSKRAQIAGLVGEEATARAYRAVVWLRLAALSAFPTMPVLALLAKALNNERILLGVGVALLLGIPCLVVGGVLNRQASNAASTYLSGRYGRPIKIKSGGTRLWGWHKELERALGEAGTPQPS